jgi:hypothetical protein
METIFKIGDKVWDDVLYPGLEGRVLSHGPVKILVYFADKSTLGNAYWPDGRIVREAKPTLSKVPYTFELPKND